MNTEKIVEGLALYIANSYKDKDHEIKHDGLSSIFVLDKEGLEQIYIVLDHEKVHVFHGQQVDPRSMSAIKEVSLIFPLILEFVNHMKSIHSKNSNTEVSEENAEKPASKKDSKGKSPTDFDWI